MIPIQFIALILAASMVGRMGDMWESGRSNVSAVLLWASLLFSQLVLCWGMWLQSKRLIRRLNDPAASGGMVTARADRMYNVGRWLSIGITATFLYGTPLPALTYHWLDMAMPWALRATEPADPSMHVPLVGELLFMLPTMLAWTALWTCSYFVELATRERSMAYLLAQGQPVHEMPTLPEYLSLQARHSFFPLMLLVVQSTFDLAGNIYSRIAGPKSTVPDYISLGGTLVVLLTLPWLMLMLWRTTPLIGPLRDRLDHVAALYRLRFRNILLWRTHSLVTNAAILGWVPFARYFLMSDALLEMFNDRQLEAVFAHEVGHGVHRHIPWYVLTVLGALALAAGGAFLAMNTGWFPPNMSESVQSILSLVLLAALMVLCVPFIAARFEHQADWFACRHMARMIRERRDIDAPPAATATTVSVPAPLPEELRQALSAMTTEAESVTLEQYKAGEYAHARPDPSAPPAPAPAQKLAIRQPMAVEAGAEIFISALDTIVESTHKARAKRGFFHPSINGRIALLRDLVSNPASVKRFEGSMFRTRVAIVALFVAGIGTSYAAYKVAQVQAESAAATTQAVSMPASR